MKTIWKHGTELAIGDELPNMGTISSIVELGRSDELLVVTERADGNSVTETHTVKKHAQVEVVQRTSLKEGWWLVLDPSGAIISSRGTVLQKHTTLDSALIEAHSWARLHVGKSCAIVKLQAAVVASQAEPIVRREDFR